MNINKTICLLIFSALFHSSTAYAKINCQKNPIYCRILKTNPSVKKKFAYKLSNYIYEYSKQFGTDPLVSIAIAMQESSIKNIDKKNTVLVKMGNTVTGISDIGVFQIHIKTVINMQKQQNWHINFNRLVKDVKYQTYWHARLLKRKINICKKMHLKLHIKPGNEWSCYHSFSYKKRKEYLKDVNRYLNYDSN